jgi:hypothetical protein
MLWGGSRRCVVIVDGVLDIVDISNIQCPQGWAVWLDLDGENEGPEGRMSSAVDPFRMRTGLNGYALFKTFATHDSGLVQKVKVGRGNKVTFSGFAHAWSNRCDDELPGEYPHCDEPGWSEGAGDEPYYGIAGEVEDDKLRNFTFQLGIDPLGGLHPFAESVVWGVGAHIYNAFRAVPSLAVIAEVDEVTVFARNTCLWPYKHNDAYWDDFELVVIDEPVPPVQFDKVVRLVPQDTTKQEYNQVKNTAFLLLQDLTFSVDSAFARGPAIKDLKVFVYEPGRMGGRKGLERYVEISHPPVPTIKYRKFKSTEPEPPPGPVPQPKPNCTISLHRQTDESGIQNYLERVQPEWIKVVNGMEDARKYKDWGAGNVDVRIPVGNSKQYIDSMDVEGYLANYDDALEANIDYVDGIEDLNEENYADPRVIEFLIKMSNEIVRRYGDAVKLVSGNWPVGNGEGAALLEWARVIAQNKHLAGYHCYHPVSPQWAEEWMEQEAQWYHLRHLYHLDPYFAANGVFVDWLGTESGGVEAVPLEGPGVLGTHGYLVGAAPRVARLSDEFIVAKEIQKRMEESMYAAMLSELASRVTGVGPLDPTGGWRDHNALNGDLDRYIRLQARLEEKINIWNLVNGNRKRGTCIFTVGAAFVGWKNYRLVEPDMDAFAEAFAA